jgi:hypothetical protein
MEERGGEGETRQKTKDKRQKKQGKRNKKESDRETCKMTGSNIITQFLKYLFLTFVYVIKDPFYESERVGKNYSSL